MQAAAWTLDTPQGMRHLPRRSLIDSLFRLRKHPEMTVSESPGGQPPQDDTALLTAALSHSWAWYEERTNRTVQVINYYIVATAIVVTAYTSAINGKHYGLAAALAITGLALTAIASVGALNGLNAAGLAEPALIEMQERVGARLKTESMRIARLRIGIRRRRAAAAVTFGLAALFNISGLLYAVTR